jgi:hypothetical protein
LFGDKDRRGAIHSPMHSLSSGLKRRGVGRLSFDPTQCLGSH